MQQPATDPATLSDATGLSPRHDTPHFAGPRASNPAHPLLTHGGVELRRFYAMQASGAFFPLGAGIVFFGWRCVCAVAIVLGAAAAATALLRRAGSRGFSLRYDDVLWQALLLALMLPAHLFAAGNAVNSSGPPLWPILPAAGIMLAGLLWLLGGTGCGRIAPVLVTYLALFILFHSGLTPRFVLARNHSVVGDVLRTGSPSIAPDDVTTEFPAPDKAPWYLRRAPSGASAWMTLPSAVHLQTYTSGHATAGRVETSLLSLVRDAMPPLEDFVVGGQPTSMGSASAIAVAIGGLLLLYRGLIDFRIPLYIFISALLALLILPVPVRVGQESVLWQWIPFLHHGVNISLALTFANYELLATPMLFTAFFLATAAAARPMTRRARTIYAPIVGVVAVVLQLYASALIGPYVAVLFASLLTPLFDSAFRPRTLV